MPDRLKALFAVVRGHVAARPARYRQAVVLVVAVLFAGYVVFFEPPTAFPSGKLITIGKGEPTKEIAASLVARHVIAWPGAFTMLVRVMGGSHGVEAGVYAFNAPAGLLTVTGRLLMGDVGTKPLRVTLYEGLTNREMGQALAEQFPNITASAFEQAATGTEGYLFPDTYAFMPDISAKTVVKTMRDNFNTRIASITPEITASEHSLKNIVIMASLLEREARTLSQRRMVAGILWNRIRLHMPLQVDAVFGYIFHKQTYSPSLADLKVDSPYNTYTHAGLPPGPICNPGLDSLLAAATPTKTKYLYYLTGKDGKMYYATTLAGHLANERKHL